MRELSLHILDLAQNSVAAGASLVKIAVEANREHNTLRISIADDGRGMSEQMVRNVRDPFFTTRTTRRVGMGIPMIEQAAKECGGSFSISSEPGAGTRLLAEFELNHIDRLPLGDMASTLVALVASNPDMDVEYTQRVDEDVFVLDTRQLRETLQEVPLSEPEVLKWIRQYVAEGIQESLRID